MKLLLLAYLSLVAAAAADDVNCDGACDVNLELPCEGALEKYEYSGNCCSLQEINGNCHLIIPTGWCDYATKGYDHCMDRKEELDEGREYECGTIHMLMATASAEKECPKSQFNFTDPIMAVVDATADLGNMVTVAMELIFSFPPGPVSRRLPPSGLEIQGVVKQTKPFLAKWLMPASDFKLKFVESNYDYATGDLALCLSVDFVARDDASINDQQRQAENIISSLNYNGEYLSNYAWKVEPAADNEFFLGVQQVMFRPKGWQQELS